MAMPKIKNFPTCSGEELHKAVHRGHYNTGDCILKWLTKMITFFLIIFPCF